MSFVSHFSHCAEVSFWQLQLSRSFVYIKLFVSVCPGAKHADLLVFSAGWLDPACYLCSLRFKGICWYDPCLGLSKGTPEPLLSFGIPFNIICL